MRRDRDIICLLLTLALLMWHLDLIGSFPRNKDTSGLWSWVVFVPAFVCSAAILFTAQDRKNIVAAAIPAVVSATIVTVIFSPIV